MNKMMFEVFELEYEKIFPEYPQSRALKEQVSPLYEQIHQTLGLEFTDHLSTLQGEMEELAGQLLFERGFYLGARLMLGRAGQGGGLILLLGLLQGLLRQSLVQQGLLRLQGLVAAGVVGVPGGLDLHRVHPLHLAEGEHQAVSPARVREMSASPPYCSEKFKVSSPSSSSQLWRESPWGKGGGQAVLGGAGQQGVHQFLHAGAGGSGVGLALDGRAVVGLGVGAEVQQDAGVPAAGAAAGQRQRGGQTQGAQNSSHSGSPPTSGVSQGNPTVKTLPSGSRRWAVTQPPWRRTVSRTMESPRPCPRQPGSGALSTR